MSELQYVPSGDSVAIQAYIRDSEGNELTGLSPTVRGHRVSDRQFWTGTGGYGASPTNLAMAEVDATNIPGLYSYTFDTSDGATEGEHVWIVDPNDASAAPVDPGSIVVGTWVDRLDVAVSTVNRALGRDFDLTTPDSDLEVETPDVSLDIDFSTDTEV